MLDDHLLSMQVFWICWNNTTWLLVLFANDACCHWPENKINKYCNTLIKTHKIIHTYVSLVCILVPGCWVELSDHWSVILGCWLLLGSQNGLIAPDTDSTLDHIFVLWYIHTTIFSGKSYFGNMALNNYFSDFVVLCWYEGHSVAQPMHIEIVKTATHLPVIQV